MISTLLTTLLIIDALVLIVLIIVLQQGNEGGLGGAFGGGNSAGFFGATGGVKLIVRATWVCGILFFILAMASSWVRTSNKYELNNQLEKSLAMPSAQVPLVNPKVEATLPTPLVPSEKTSSAPIVPAKPSK
ncbi:preprotein translocase subunit SecG [Fluviispira multicolorata]|uniref:Protein-export membrane protein SecG n=1 Tax=Fluviispira multicolorata TaxID=2654512 RepID=A0A833JB74_9BACT|nr:preprotein translocase subunit SecG [Fluviispira multicolorata]KAB8029102.1 preprotein translocase subunit SecG [Fluviispira multicolorata]